MATGNERSDVAVLLRTEDAVARVLAASSDEDDAYPQLLAAIGGALGWAFGALWMPADAEGSFLRCAHTWDGDSDPVATFAATSRSVMLAPGQGIPGEVWQTDRPAWIADAGTHPRPLPRARAATQAGLRSAFAFPVRCAGKVLGVMEFFAAAPVAPDDQLLATMSSLGSQIGQFAERCRAERGVHESEARKTAILNAAFDCIITMDGAGNIVEVNAATESTFGYSSEEMVGRELAELMIPPGALREDHRRGVRRYMDTGASRIVGHPVELTAMRADGSTFPVELAVTRPDLPGPPLFCGYLRDVTERRRAELAAAGTGRGAGRAAPGGDGGGRGGGARAAVRARRRGGRARARRARRQHPALQRRWHRAHDGRLERARRDDSGRHDAGPRRRHDRLRRCGAPGARRATTRSTA